MAPNTSDGNETPNTNFVRSYLSLRKWLGVIGLALPIVIVLINYGVSLTYAGIDFAWLPSISIYYYTAAGDYLVASLCAVGVFLIAYTGYDKTDNWLCNIAGAGAIGVAFFPTGIDDDVLLHLSQCIGNSAVRECTPVWWTDSIEYLHYLSALMFLGSFVFLANTQFTRDGSDASKRTFRGTLRAFFPSLEKIRLAREDLHQNGRLKGLPGRQKRNFVYRSCGYVTLGCVLCLIANVVLGAFDFLGDFPTIYFFEAIAVFAFGIAWLVKGNMLRSTLFSDP